MPLDFIQTKQALVLFKLEADYGVDPVPTPALNAVFVNKIELQPSLPEITLERMRDTAASPGVAIGAAYYDITAELPLSGPPDPGAGADLVAPEAAAMLQAAGLQMTTTDEDVDTWDDRHTFARNSLARQVSGTLYVYLFAHGGDVELYIVKGCVLTWDLAAKPGGEVVWKLTGKGLYEPPTNPATPASPVFVSPSDKSVPRGAVITVGGRSDWFDDVTINGGGAVNVISDKSATYGVAGFVRTYETPSIDLDPRKLLTSTLDIDSEVLEDTPLAISLQINTVRGAKYVLAAANAQRGTFKLDMGKDVARAPGKFYLRDTDAGNGDDSFTLYTERI